jgi:hypothetical protein
MVTSLSELSRQHERSPETVPPPALDPFTSLPRTALVLEGNGKRWNSQTLGAPALRREAECDTTGNIGRQHSVHTRNEPSVQGSVAWRSQSASFASLSLRID